MNPSQTPRVMTLDEIISSFPDDLSTRARKSLILMALGKVEFPIRRTRALRYKQTGPVTVKELMAHGYVIEGHGRDIRARRTPGYWEKSKTQ